MGWCPSGAGAACLMSVFCPVWICPVRPSSYVQHGSLSGCPLPFYPQPSISQSVMGSEGLSPSLSLVSGFFLSFSGFKQSFLFFYTFSISVSQSFLFQSSRHGNVWYSLAKERAGLFKVEKTIGEVKKSILPFPWWEGVLTLHGF